MLDFKFALKANFVNSSLGRIQTRAFFGFQQLEEDKERVFFSLFAGVLQQ